MKSHLRRFFLLSILALAGSAFAGANMPGVSVVAKEKATGQVAFEGKTNSAGKFATGTLPAGKYVVEFRSRDASSAFQVAMSGVKNAKQAKMKGGVGFDVEVPKAAKISGQVSAAEGAAVAANAKADKNVKIINGKRYVWVRGEIGSNMGGKWIPEEDAVATDGRRTGRNSAEQLREMQDLGGQGAASGR